MTLRFKWFMRYRDMEPPRSIEKLHRSCTEAAPKKDVSLRSLKQYSVDFHLKYVIGPPSKKEEIKWIFQHGRRHI